MSAPTEKTHAGRNTSDDEFRRHMNTKADERRQARKLATMKLNTRKKSNKGRRAATTAAMRWLREFMTPFIYGEAADGEIFPSLTHSQLTGRINSGWRIQRLPNYRLEDHFSGKENLYYQSRGDTKSKRILVMLDIDVRKWRSLGTKEGAEKFAKYLQTIYPGLYIELSTGGIGQHGYLIVECEGYTAQETNQALKRLDVFNRYHASYIKADIEQIELKGTCIELIYNAGKLKDVKSGSFAKIPRDVSRFNEWTKTTVLTVDQLNSSAFDIPAESTSAPITDKPVRKNQSGSISGVFIDQEQLQNLPNFERLWRSWYGDAPRKIDGRNLTAEFAAIGLMLLVHFKADPNKDGSLPRDRVASLWTALYQAGDVSRGFSPNLWAAFRNLLSERGHIDWQEHRFERPAVYEDQNGKKVIKGVACKWRLTDHFTTFLKYVARARPSSVALLAANLPQGGGKNLRPTPSVLKETDWNFWATVQGQKALEDILIAA